jgi:hypothetical protein
MVVEPWAEERHANAGEPVLTPPARADAERLRALFQTAGYGEPMLLERMGTIIPPPTTHHQWGLLLQRTAEPTPFNCLTRLFFLGAPVAGDALAAVMPAWFAPLCVECGLLAEAGQTLKPLALLSPCEDLWVAADLHQQRRSASGREHILTVNAPALNLLRFAIRQRTGSTLDLCSGMALHALVASRFSDTVVASDLSPRARMFAEFNAALNGCDRIACVSGDRFAAVAGRRFDLILCNPPFVVSPAAEFLYRDNPLELDEFCHRLLQEAPAHLNEGGHCQVVCEWVELQGQSWQDRLRGWLADTGCDAWVLQANRLLPSTYVLQRGREYETGDPEEDQRRYQRWREYFATRRVAAVHGGVITIRRRSGTNWMSLDELRREVSVPVGDALVQGIAARDFLHHHAEVDQMLGCRPRVSPAARLEQLHRWSDGRWQVQSIVLSTGAGIPVSIGIDAPLRDLLEGFDGNLTLANASDAVADRLGTESAAIRDDLVGVVRKLIEQGLLLP